MNRNVVIVLIGGFVVAILVAVLVQATLGGGKTQPEDTVEKSYVLVAAKDLRLGATIAEGDLKWQTWPGVPFGGAIVRQNDMKASEALTGRLIARVSKDQPVLQSYVHREGRGNIVAATLEPGMRAVAIPVKATTMAGGFVTPGDYVDVIMTYRVRSGRNSAEGRKLVNQYATETVLQNVRVLAVDQEASREGDNAKIAKSVTLAVTRAGAERLALSSEMGELILSLRGIGDQDTAPLSKVTTDVQSSRVMQDLAEMEDSDTGGAIKIYHGAVVSDQRTRSVHANSADDDSEADSDDRGSEGEEE